MFFSTQIKTFGLDISDQSIKIAQIQKIRDNLQLTSFNKTSLPQGILVNGEIQNQEQLIKYIKNTINQSKTKIENNYVVACLPEVKTFIKLIKIKLEDKNLSDKYSIKELIKKCLPKHIPMPIEEVVFDWQIINKKQNYIEVLIGVAPKNTVLAFNDLIKKCGLMPISLEIEAGSITRSIFTLSNKKLPTKIENSCGTVYFIIDCGASRSGLIVWSDQTIKFTTSLKICGTELTKKISQDLKLDFKKAEKLKNIYGLEIKNNKSKIKKILNPLITELTDEITKAKEFYENNFDKDKKKYEIILSGGSSNLKALDTELAQILNMKVSLANPLINLALKQKIKINQQEIQSYTTAIGLALRSFFVKNY